MTTNLKIQIDDKADVELIPIPGSANSTLVIEIDNLSAWNKGVPVGTNGKHPDNLTGVGNGFPVDDNPLNNAIRISISHLEITGPTDILTTFRNLIILKDDVKDLGTHAQDSFDFELTLDKDISKQSEHWDITAESVPTAFDRRIRLSVADFGGSLDTSKISIDDTEYHSDPNKIIKVVENRKNQKQALLDLENLLKTLPARYGDLVNVDEGPDLTFTDPTADLGDAPSPALLVPRVGLWAYPTGTLPGYSAITPEPNNIKHILFGLYDGFNNPYEDRIVNWIKYLEETKKILATGLNKKSQVNILINKTLGGGYEEADTLEIKKEPGFYKGFPLIDPNLQALLDPSDNKFKLSKIDPDKPVRFTKKNIDNFRLFATGYTGPDHDIFTKEKTIKDKDGNDVQVYANRLPEECFGFQPGDVWSATSGKFPYVNGGWHFDGISKIFLDILSAQNADEAMDLAFFGKDYDEPLSDNSTRKGNPKRGGDEKHPNVNLQFNEVKAWSRLEHLEHYYDALQDSASCVWRIPDDASGTGARDAPKYDDPDIKKKIDAGYNLAKEFIKDYEKLINAKITSLNKTQLEEAKTKLEKWKTTLFYTRGGVWKPIIDNFLIEVDDALSHLNSWKTELAGLKNRASELAKKIYQNCQPDQDGFTEEVFEELKNLVKLLEEAHGTKTANTKDQLEKFIADSQNDTEKKKALEIAKKVKQQDSDNKNVIETALEKLKEPGEVKLEQARTKLKNLLAGLKTGGQDAYQVVVADIENSETDLNKVAQIWQKLLEIDAAANDNQGQLLETLNNLKNDDSNKKAWEALNKYIRDNQSLGYPEEMLKKLNDWVEKRKKDYKDIKKAQTKAEFEIAKVEFMKKPEYKNNQQDYDEIYFPLAEKAAEIREKGTQASAEEKDLVELMVIVVSEYSDWKTQLTDLEDKFNKLKDYAEEGTKAKVVEKFSTIQKEALKKLMSKMEVKLQEWKAEKTKTENNTGPSENPSWYKTPLGIIGIVCAVAILAAIVYYLVKQNTNED